MNQTQATTETKPKQLRFSCPSCRGRVKVPLAYAGRKGKCHHCRAVIRIPAAPQREVREGGVFQAPAPRQVASSSDVALAQPGSVSGWESLDARIERALAELPARGTPPSQGGLKLLPPCERYREPATQAGTQRGSRGAGRSTQGSRSCRECGLLHEERGAVCAACREDRRGGIRRAPRDLKSEAHVRALAFWQMLPGALGVVFNLIAAALLVALAPPQLASATVLPLLLIGLPICALSFGFGYCLWRYHDWARWLTVILSALGLLGGLVGLLGGLNVYTLLGTALGAAWHGSVINVLVNRPHLFEPAYRDAALASRRPVPFWSSPFFWIPAALFVLGLVAAAVLISKLLVLVG